MASRRLAHPKWLLTGFWICVFIAIGVVARRLAALANSGPAGNSPTASLDATFDAHAALTLAHIVPAAVFVGLAVLVLFRAKHNKWVDRAFFLLGAITGLTAYAMSAYAVGGRTERAAVFLFDSWFLYCLARAFRFGVQGNTAAKREWTTRGVAILLGIATTRPVMGAFFATSSLTHLTFHQFFGIAFWIGFSINAVVIEFWLHSKRRFRLHGEPPPPGLRAGDIAHDL
ncbi:MAG: DUF2306 domain-containing protein [Acidobacteriaceae bacterium]|nr:DUF2306 domain-containing protein [Acidobacteriaceae bacterium]